MTKHLLVTRPAHDPDTSYLYSFSRGIISLVKHDKIIRLSELSLADANRKNLEKQLNTPDKTLVFLNGHGNQDTVFGHQDLPILDSKNISLTKNKIVYALACDSLVNLGKLAIIAGAIAYIGYKDEFMWVGDETKENTPEKDKNAIPFRRVCHNLISSLVEGTPIIQAINQAKNEYKKMIKSYGDSTDIYGDAPGIGFALSWDLNALDYIGDPNATF